MAICNPRFALNVVVPNTCSSSNCGATFEVFDMQIAKPNMALELSIQVLDFIKFIIHGVDFDRDGKSFIQCAYEGPNGHVMWMAKDMVTLKGNIADDLLTYLLVSRSVAQKKDRGSTGFLFRLGWT